MSGEAFGIRGILHSGVGTGGEAETGSYYVDGVALTGFAKRFGPQNLWDVQQVEVLRGPQSTNVGRNALAGAVSVRTNDPELANLGAVRLLAGEYQTLGAAVMGNVQLTDNSAIRLAADYDQTDGFISNPVRGEDDYGSDENTTLRGKWLWTSGEDERLRVVLNAQYAESTTGWQIVWLEFFEGEECAPLTEVDPADRLVFANLPATNANESWNLTANVSFRLNDQWTLTSLTSFLEADFMRTNDTDYLDSDDPLVQQINNVRNVTDRNWAEDLRLTFDGGNGLRGVVGVYTSRIENLFQDERRQFVQLAEAGVPSALADFYPESILVDSLTDDSRETENYAFFTEVDWEISDLLTVFGGFRYDFESQKIDGLGITTTNAVLPDPANFPSPPFPPQVGPGIAQVNAGLQSQLGTTAIEAEADFEAFLPQIGFSLHWSEDFTTGFHYKRGYRAGGAGRSRSDTFFEFDPEHLDNFEAFLRSRVFDGRLIVKANTYYGSWIDQQVSFRLGGSNFDLVTINAGESEIYGFEFESSFLVTNQLSGFFNVGFSHTEFIEFVTEDGTDLSGNRFARAPEWTASLGGRWRFLEHWFVQGSINYQGQAFNEVENTPELEHDARTIVNLQFGYEHGPFRARIFVENVFDEVYLLSNDFDFTGTGRIGTVGDPRVVSASIEYRF